MFTDSKTIISGNFIEIFKYEKKVWYGSLPQSISKGGGRRKENGERSKESFQRAKGNLKRIVNANAWSWFDKNGKPFLPIFFTLTFAENITNIKKANYEFTKFIQRFNYEMKYTKSQLKYICVLEFQKRGAVHYHFIFFNLPYTENLKERIEKCWDNGFTFFKKINRIKNVGNYMAKYMSKELDNEKLYGQKAYFTSRGLKRPKVRNDESVANFLLNSPLKEIECFQEEYESSHAGKTIYRSFNLTKEQELKNTLLAFIK